MLNQRSSENAMEPSKARWVAAWYASPQPVWGNGLPLAADVPANLEDVTVRQIIRLGYAGSRVRLLFSNRYGHKPVHLDGVSIAPSYGDERIGTKRSMSVTFSGGETLILAPGVTVASDPIAMAGEPGDRLAVSMRFITAPPIDSFHWEGRSTAFILPGDQRAAPAPSVHATTERRLFLSSVLVESADCRGAIIVFGDSITDGASATLDRDTRWPDFLAVRAERHGLAIVNAGISGARLLSDGMGTKALARFEQDVISQNGAAAVVLLLGINDITWPGTVFAPDEVPMTFERMIVGYRAVIERARAANLRIIGGTMPPFADALPGTPMAETFYTPAKNALRLELNDWIMNAGAFDSVIDFASLLADPENPDHLLPLYDGGDHLHPGDTGNRAMADAVDLNLLLPR